MVNKSICRACLKQKLSIHCKSMSPEEENEESCNILEMFSYCVPELDLNLVINPVICNDCIKQLAIAFKFKIECLKNEEKLLKYSHSRNTKVDLTHFCENKKISPRKRKEQSAEIVKIQQELETAETLIMNSIGEIPEVTPEDVRYRENCYGCKNKLSDPAYHSKNNLSPFICHHCAQAFGDIQDLRKHMMKHIRQRKCKVCGKLFRDLHSLTKHLRSHSGSKPFSCTICPKSFREKYKLDQHVKQHNNDNTVTCKVCKKSMSTTYNLKVHMKQHRNQPTCELCGETFASKRELVKHLETDSETCGHNVKPKGRNPSVEIVAEEIKQELIKIEPEYVLDTQELLDVYKNENEGEGADEIDVIN